MTHRPARAQRENGKPPHSNSISCGASARAGCADRPASNPPAQTDRVSDLRLGDRITQSGPMFRRVRVAITGLLWSALAVAAEPAGLPLQAFQRVDIAPTKTSIYIGSVSMTMPTFHREGMTYSSTYVAKVFPYFFESEKGELSIELSDEDLRRLERGEVIQFTGRGKNTDGEERRIEGRAIPTDAHTGKIKVRVFVSKKIQLIFNTTYRFPA